MNLYRTLHSAIKEYTFFSSTHGTLIDHLLNNKTSFNKYQRINVTQTTFSDHNVIKWEIRTLQNMHLDIKKPFKCDCWSPYQELKGRPFSLTFWDGPHCGVCFSLKKSTSYLSLCLSLNSFCDETSRTWASGFPGGTVVKNPPANAGDTGSSPGPGRSHMLQSN